MREAYRKGWVERTLLALLVVELLTFTPLAVALKEGMRWQKPASAGGGCPEGVCHTGASLSSAGVA